MPRDGIRARDAGPTVSVILPTYQRRELVKRAVASVLAQTYRDFELIVVDDGSTDGTREALVGLDDRLRYQWQPNRGVSAARNAGLRLARGSIVAFLDSDDRWFPDHLAVLNEVLDRSPGAVAASTCPGFVVAGRERVTDARLMDCRLRPMLSLEATQIGYPSCVAVRREAIEAVGGFDQRMEAMEDTDLFVRLATIGSFVTVRRRTIVHQATAGSLTDRTRRSGARLVSAELAADNLAAVAEHLPEAKRSALLREARAMRHLVRAMSAVDRRDVTTAKAALEEACRALPRLSEFPAAVEYRTRRYLTRADDPAERLRSAAMLAELWPDRSADAARYMRLFAIATALRMRRPRAAARLLAGWKRGGTLRFASRVAPVVLYRARRRLQGHRTRGREVAELGWEEATTRQPRSAGPGGGSAP
jgi:glycosyltransferase involved in cell wall biosynthesis